MYDPDEFSSGLSDNCLNKNVVAYLHCTHFILFISYVLNVEPVGSEWLSAAFHFCPQEAHSLIIYPQCCNFIEPVHMTWQAIKNISKSESGNVRHARFHPICPPCATSVQWPFAISVLLFHPSLQFRDCEERQTVYFWIEAAIIRTEQPGLCSRAPRFRGCSKTISELEGRWGVMRRRANGAHLCFLPPKCPNC